ncbi:MAG: carboxypeptidase-like regulatory domain-containing protein [Chitinophagaceae bacterium]|nr:carboxypeptidase-like regulatory domain-containing protein [Chitinophagaceae bacterium]MCW5905539.1 carboxypeptidase-like regulatory domain-containing protein [Chitinophagaceae bacterium]
MKYFYTLLFLLLSTSVFAYTIHGNIRSKDGKLLPYASILIKGTTEGTTANSKGFYSLSVEAGVYTIVCQHIGYKTEEKKVTVTNENIIIDFDLEMQSYHLTDVEVKAGGEDPAYEIIRNAIKKRAEHLHEIKKYQCEVYLKGQLQLRDYPTKILGKKVDFEDGDTSKKKMVFLSETIAKLFVEHPNNAKVEVISTRVSGYSDGFGFSFPQIFSFYENIVKIGTGLNPRGFISPISNNALHYYKYKFEGTYYENGKEINRIKVIPKRKYEPLFAGYISITENDWRIYSTELYLLKEQQMQLLDTLHIQQLYVPIKDKWVLKQQVIYPSGKILGFDFFGSFVQVFSHYEIDPTFKKKFFDNILLKVYDSANKKPTTYWDSIRPVPLLDEEAIDYKKKDSLEQVKKSPAYLDSLDRKNNKVTFSGLILTGQTFTKRKTKESLSINSLLDAINYNTVEGWVLNFTPTYYKRYEGRKSLRISPDFRYGFNNKHFNSSIASSYSFGKKYLNTISIAGGKNIFQFNNNSPIQSKDNTLATLLYTRNYLKIYEAWFTKVSYRTGLGKGFDFFGDIEYQDRLALKNLDNIQTWRKYNGRVFTPNYPIELGANSFKSHKATIVDIGLRFRPGTKYIELPNRTINIGSKYPVLTATLTYGIKGLINSDVDFSKWNFSISDNLNIKLGGQLRYKINVGGFIHAKTIYAPDYQHIAANRTATATTYLNSFQLAPYYAFSNTSNFMTSVHVAYHLKGLLTNKIPLLRKWNWFFVFSGSALYIQPNVQYYEGMFSLENILKVLRVDFIQSFGNTNYNTSGIRINFPLE